MDNTDNTDKNTDKNTNNTDHPNIIKWNDYFTEYCEYEKKCIDNINAIGEIKNNLKKLLGNQKKDDLLFYKSLIESSHFYLVNSLRLTYPHWYNPRGLRE